MTDRHGNSYRLELHGVLGGEWVPLVEQHWRSIVHGAPLAQVTVVLSNVDFIDRDGERLLQRMADDDVQFVVAGCMNRYVIDNLKPRVAAAGRKTLMRIPPILVMPVGFVALALGLLRATAVVNGAQPSLPPPLAAFLAEEAHATASDRDALQGGNPLVKFLDADPSQEVAVFGAVWINAPSSSYVEQVKKIEQFERGDGFRVTQRISDPPQADDFAALSISDDDFNNLKNCKLGDCALKLGSDALQTLRNEVDWDRPSARADANAVFRRLALRYVNGYREGGNTRLAVYRDKERPTFVANEFRSMIERLPRLGAELPDLTRYLLDYPNATLARSTNFLYWQEVKFGLKPTIRISHLVIQEHPDATVIASKMLYSSHYFWTALELRVLLRDAARGPGFWLITVNRCRSDGLSGFTGRVVRSRVRSEVADGARAALLATKARLESKAGRP